MLLLFFNETAPPPPSVPVGAILMVGVGGGLG